MKNTIPFFSWRPELENVKMDAIDNDLMLFVNPTIPSTLNTPFKVDVVTAIICIKGTTRGQLNLKSYTTQSPCLTIVLPDQILQYEYLSEDFAGLFIVMSRRFIDSLNIQERLPLFLSIQDNPSFHLDKKELDAAKTYFSMLQGIVREKDHPYRMEVAKHLTLSFFYGIGYQRHNPLEKENKSKHEMLVESFLSLAQANYKEQRGLKFFADKLCLTSRYLSKVVMDTSGMSAADWIDSYVVLEAKALLKSTNMTIQQISDELNFPSQSFFGKYFKRQVGVSPSEYKRK